MTVKKQWRSDRDHSDNTRTECNAVLESDCDHDCSRTDEWNLGLTSGLAKEDHFLGERWLHLNLWKENSKDIRTTTGANSKL
jgi:hypothetical protein